MSGGVNGPDSHLSGSVRALIGALDKVKDRNTLIAYLGVIVLVAVGFVVYAIEDVLYATIIIIFILIAICYITSKIVNLYGAHLGVTKPDLLVKQGGKNADNVIPLPSSKEFDAFVSTPMASLGEVEKGLHRRMMENLVPTLVAQRGFEKSYCAWQNIGLEDFQTSNKSFIEVWSRLRSSRIFIMILPAKIQTSCLVEAGMALALKIDSIYFVKKLDDLPFLLKEIYNIQGKMNTPRVKVLTYSDENSLRSKFLSSDDMSFDDVGYNEAAKL